MATYYQTVQFIKKELDGHYPGGEISSLISIIFGHLEQLSLSSLHMKYNEEINGTTENEIKKITDRLKKDEPIQYIFGETEFYGLKIKVNQDVLIPRQETEELVDWIIKENHGSELLNVFDIGTGSGCIAIALAKNLNTRNITAIDVSPGALKIAKGNAAMNGLKIKFKKLDILKTRVKKYKSKWDIIVSNPPYIPAKEKVDMLDNVLKNEPRSALFVDDESPLVFYEAIAGYATKTLKPGGQLFFEINENYGLEVFNLLLGEKFDEVHLKKDLNGKDRMIWAKYKTPM